jgi:flagellin-like protein
MKALKKGVSPVIATLLLILIAVAAAVLLYTWVSSLSANVAGSKVTGKTLAVIQATWALGNSVKDGYLSAKNFTANRPVLIISFKAPPAVVGGQGAGMNLITLDNVDVIYAGRVICHYSAFALSAWDVQHTGATTGFSVPKVSGLDFGGYVGNTIGTLDGNDTYAPGGIVVNNRTKADDPADFNKVGYAFYDNATTSNLAFDKNVPFATIVAQVWNVQYVSNQKVETYFNSTNANIRFDRWTGDYLAYNTAKTNAIPTFDLAKVGQDDWSLVVWCPQVNPNVMNSVQVRIQFQDGSTWETMIPLTVQ